MSAKTSNQSKPCLRNREPSYQRTFSHQQKLPQLPGAVFLLTLALTTYFRCSTKKSRVAEEAVLQIRRLSNGCSDAVMHENKLLE